MGATVYDLVEAKLCYAPQHGSANDPMNFAGMASPGFRRDDDVAGGEWQAIPDAAGGDQSSYSSWRWCLIASRKTAASECA